jgi:hypothetical protein
VVPLGPIALVAHQLVDDHVTSVGLRLAEEELGEAPATTAGRLKHVARRILARLG